MHRPKRWNIAEPHPSTADLAGQLKASPLLAQVLLNRGLTEATDCSTFLRPSLKHLHEPFAIANLRKAAERIAKAIKDGERIFVYGDYDVDGITATSILWHAITLFGGKVEFYIPHRIDEGYGLNADAIRQLCDQGAQLIVTVDCGVTATEQAKVACERGVDLIITDHHEWKESGPGCRVSGPGEEETSEVSSRNPEPETRNPLLPECYTVVHPRLVD